MNMDGGCLRSDIGWSRLARWKQCEIDLCCLLVIAGESRPPERKGKKRASRKNSHYLKSYDLRHNILSILGHFGLYFLRSNVYREMNGSGEEVTRFPKDKTKERSKRSLFGNDGFPSLFPSIILELIELQTLIYHLSLTLPIGVIVLSSVTFTITLDRSDQNKQKTSLSVICGTYSGLCFRSAHIKYMVVFLCFFPASNRFVLC